MARYIQGLLLAGLVAGLTASCNFFEKDEDDEEESSGSGGSGPLVPTGQTQNNPANGQQQGTTQDNTQASAGQMAGCESLAGLEGCSASSQQAQNIETNILLVMDKSGSMSNVPPGYPVPKWDALIQALTAALTEMQDRIDFGLELYPTMALDQPIPVDCAERCCEMPQHNEMNVSITPGAAGVNAIIGTLQNTVPAGGTPTAIAIARAHQYFAAGAGAGLTGERYVLLATDGGPNCNPTLGCDIESCTPNIDQTPGCESNAQYSCCIGNPNGCLDADQTVARIQELATIGVKTIVIGIPGSEMYSENLNAFAKAGGAPQDSAAAQTYFYEVSAEGGVDELTATFREITRKLVSSCEVPLAPAESGRPIALNQVNVAINCSIVPKLNEDESQNWELQVDAQNNPTAVLIMGPHCDTIKQQGVDRIDAVLGCNTRIY